VARSARAADCFLVLVAQFEWGWDANKSGLTGGVLGLLSPWSGLVASLARAEDALDTTVHAGRWMRRQDRPASTAGKRRHRYLPVGRCEGRGVSGVIAQTAALTPAARRPRMVGGGKRELTTGEKSAVMEQSLGGRGASPSRLRVCASTRIAYSRSGRAAKETRRSWPETGVALNNIITGQTIRRDAAGIFLIAVRVIRQYLLE
jgi:hypothetical protein